MIAYFDVINPPPPPTFITDSILLKISLIFLEIMVSRIVTSYEPQAMQMNEEPTSESSLDLTLTQHPHDEDLHYERCALVLKSIPLELGIITFLQTLAPW
jgi:hypothetical protein